MSSAAFYEGTQDNSSLDSNRSQNLYKKYNAVALQAFYARIEHREQGFPVVTGSDPCFEELVNMILKGGLHEITKCLKCRRSVHTLCCDREHAIDKRIHQDVETYDRNGTTMGYCGYYLPCSNLHKIYTALKTTILVFEEVHLPVLEAPETLDSVCVLCCARILRSPDPSTELRQIGWTLDERIQHGSLDQSRQINGKPNNLCRMFDQISF